MSVCPNTAATERIFSKMGAIHRVCRSRLRAGRAQKAAVVVKDHLDRGLRSGPKHVVQATGLPSKQVGGAGNEDDDDEQEAEGSVKVGSLFTSVVNDAIDAADHDDNSAFSTMLQIPPSDSWRSAQMFHCDGLFIHHPFYYTSPVFRQINDDVWESG